MLFLDVAGKLACPCDSQSCAGRSLALLARSTMPDWSAGEGSDKTSTLVLQVGDWAWGQHPHPVKTLICFQNINLALKATSSGRGKASLGEE